MILKASDVDRLAEMLPLGTVIEATDVGIRITSHNEYQPLTGAVIQAALILGLDPSQIVDNCYFNRGSWYSELTHDEADYEFSVTFLYQPIPDAKGK